MDRIWIMVYFASWCAALVDREDIDWRCMLTPQFRRSLINRMTNTFKRGFPATRLELSEDLAKMAEVLEGQTYANSTSRSDYFTQISLRMIKVEQTLPPVGNSIHTDPAISNQNLLYQVNRDIFLFDWNTARLSSLLLELFSISKITPFPTS